MSQRVDGNLEVVGIIVQDASESANTVWAAPNGVSGPPSFRALVTADLPGGGTGTVNKVRQANPTAQTFTGPTTISFDRTDFYLKADSGGNPIVHSTNAGGGGGGTGNFTKIQQSNPTSQVFSLPKTLSFDRNDFYLKADSAAQPTVHIVGHDGTYKLVAQTAFTGGSVTAPRITFPNFSALAFSGEYFYIRGAKSASLGQGAPVVSFGQEYVPLAGTAFGPTATAGGIGTFPSNLNLSAALDGPLVFHNIANQTPELVFQTKGYSDATSALKDPYFTVLEAQNPSNSIANNFTFSSFFDGSSENYLMGLVSGDLSKSLPKIQWSNFITQFTGGSSSESTIAMHGGSDPDGIVFNTFAAANGITFGFNGTRVLSILPRGVQISQTGAFDAIPEADLDVHGSARANKITAGGFYFFGGTELVDDIQPGANITVTNSQGPTGGRVVTIASTGGGGGISTVKALNPKKTFNSTTVLSFNRNSGFYLSSDAAGQPVVNLTDFIPLQGTYDGRPVHGTVWFDVPQFTQSPVPPTGSFYPAIVIRSQGYQSETDTRNNPVMAWLPGITCDLAQHANRLILMAQDAPNGATTWSFSMVSTNPAFNNTYNPRLIISENTVTIEGGQDNTGTLSVGGAGGGNNIRFSGNGFRMQMLSTNASSLTVGNPDFSWSLDQTTGMRFPASGNVALTAGGTDILSVKPSGVQISQTGAFDAVSEADLDVHGSIRAEKITAGGFYLINSYGEVGYPPAAMVQLSADQTNGLSGSNQLMPVLFNQVKYDNGGWWQNNGAVSGGSNLGWFKVPTALVKTTPFVRLTGQIYASTGNPLFLQVCQNGHGGGAGLPTFVPTTPTGGAQSPTFLPFAGQIYNFASPPIPCNIAGGGDTFYVELGVNGAITAIRHARTWFAIERFGG